MKHHIVLGVLLFALFVSPLLVFAQDSSGVSLNPATIQEPADPGSRIESQIEVTNLSSSEQVYYIAARDIVGVRDGNTPIYADGEQEKTGFEMSSWLELPTEPYTVAPGEKFLVPIIINVPETATPGDHFAGVFVSRQPPRLREIGAGVGFDVATIVIAKISGDRIIDAQIREFSTEKIIHGTTDVNFSVRIQNSGSDIARPYGPLEVYNMFGRRVTSLTFNESLGGVFPGTVRDFVLSWSDKNPGFGRYQAMIALAYETELGNRTINSSVSFWILPLNIILPALGVLFVLLFISYIGVKMYVRRAVQSVSSGRGKLVRRRQRNKQISALMLVSVVLLSVTALFLVILLLLFA